MQANQLSWAELKQRFLENPGVNPRTGRNINIGGPTYQALVREFGAPGNVVVAPTTQYSRGFPLNPPMPTSQLSQLNLLSQLNQNPQTVIRPVSVPPARPALTRVPTITPVSTQSAQPIAPTQTITQITQSIVLTSQITAVRPTIQLIPVTPKPKPNKDVVLAKWGAIRNSSADVVRTDGSYTSISRPNLSWSDQDILSMWTGTENLSVDILDYISNEYQRLYSTL